MATAWFFLLAGILTFYAVLDGWDLGVGAIYLLIARSEEERRTCIAAIGPLWNGNEVWLIAAGGALFLSFPRVYASSFSGFYLALMLVLWLLIVRGVSLELRNQLKNPLWTAFWDTGFTVGSLPLALLLGVALGNLVRGLPIDQHGNFQGTFTLMLNPYSLLVGLLSLAVLSLHGAHYLRVKTIGVVHDRALSLCRVLGPVVGLLVILTSILSASERANLLHNFMRFPAAFLIPLAGAASLAGVVVYSRRDNDPAAFGCGVGLIVTLLGTAGISVYPDLLHSTIDPAYSLNVYNASSAPHALMTGFLTIGTALVGVLIYQSFVYRVFWGKVLPEHLEGGHY